MLGEATTLLRFFKDDKTLIFNPDGEGKEAGAVMGADTLVRMSRPSGRWRGNEGDR